MKFSLKTIAAAVALAAAATGANAAIDLATTGMPNTNVALGGSELVFFAWDSVAGSSFTFDTGLKLEDFRPASVAANANQSFSFASLANASGAFGSYLTSIGGDFTNTTWGVMALRQGTAGGVQGSITMATTVRENGDLVAAGQKSGALKSIDTTFFAPTLAAGNAAGHAADASLTGDFGVDGNANYWGNSLGSMYGGKLAIEADNVVGSAGYKFFELQAKTSNTQVAVAAEYAGQWSFNGSTLAYTVAAVPEPESYAMFLAGLGLMGAIARRRRAK